MSELPFDLQHEPEEPKRDEISRKEFATLNGLIVVGFMLALLLGLVLSLYYKLHHAELRIERLDALPLRQLEDYSAFSQQVTGDIEQIHKKQGSSETNLMIVQGHVDQLNEVIGSLTPGIDADRLRMDQLEKRLSDLTTKLTAQQKSAVDLQRKIGRQQATEPAPPNMQLFSVRSIGTVHAVRLLSKSGEVSPLMRAGDHWNGWQFVRLDGSNAVFSLRGKDQVLAL